MSSADHQPTPRRVLIAGGGVAGLDAVLAVRALAPELEVRLLTPKRRSTYRPMAFGGPGAVHVDLPALAAERGFTLTRDALDTVRPGERVVITQDRERLAYDELVLAVGARRRAGVRGALPFRGPRDVARVEAALERLEEQNSVPGWRSSGRRVRPVRSHSSSSRCSRRPGRDFGGWSSGWSW